MSVEMAKDYFIQTGNYTIDSILSMKFEKAQQEGIKVEHDIFIPSNLNIDYIDMTIILAGMLNCAIRDIMYGPDEVLTFTMRYQKGMLKINMSHTNRVSDEERKKLKYVYRDDVAMRNIIKIAEKYTGGMKSEIKDGCVFMSVMLIVPEGNKTII